MSQSPEYAGPCAEATGAADPARVDQGRGEGISAAAPLAALSWPPPRPGEIDEDETASEPPDVVHDDSHHWPQPKDDAKPADRRRESED